MGGLVDAWLQGIGLGYAVPMCSAHGINTPETLSRLEVVDFPELGISDQNDRKKLFYLIQRVRLALNRVREDENAKSEARASKRAGSDLPAPGVDSRMTPLSIRMNQAEVANVGVPTSSTVTTSRSQRQQEEAGLASIAGEASRDTSRRAYQPSPSTQVSKQSTFEWDSSRGASRLHTSHRRRTTAGTSDTPCDSPEDVSVAVDGMPSDPEGEQETDFSERSETRLSAAEDARQSAVVAAAAANQAVASISQVVSLGVHRPSARRSRVSNFPVLPQDRDSSLLAAQQPLEQLEEPLGQMRDSAIPGGLAADKAMAHSTRSAQTRTPRGASGGVDSSFVRARARSNASPASTRSDSCRKKLERRSGSREFTRREYTSDELPPTPPRDNAARRLVRDVSEKRSPRNGGEEAKRQTVGTPSKAIGSKSRSPVTPVRSSVTDDNGGTGGRTPPRHSPLRDGSSSHRRDSGGSSSSGGGGRGSCSGNRNSSTGSGQRTSTPRNDGDHFVRPRPLTLERRSSSQGSPLSARGSGERLQRSPASRAHSKLREESLASSEISVARSVSTPRLTRRASSGSSDVLGAETASDLAVRLISAHREDVTCAVAAARMDEQLVTQSKSGSQRHIAAMNEYARGLDGVLGERLAAATKLRAALDSYIALRRGTGSTRVGQGRRGTPKRSVVKKERGIEA